MKSKRNFLLCTLITTYTHVAAVQASELSDRVFAKSQRIENKRINLQFYRDHMNVSSDEDWIKYMALYNQYMKESQELTDDFTLLFVESGAELRAKLQESLDDWQRMKTEWLINHPPKVKKQR